ncbi:MAG: hypothetical protein ACXAC7_16205 [Candidatus Hodarchaeales archaeon]|jgi:hypothetical protein
MIERKFDDYETFEKAQQIGAKSFDEYSFLLEMKKIEDDEEEENYSKNNH